MQTIEIKCKGAKLINFKDVLPIQVSADDLKQDFDLPNLNIEKFVEGFLEDETLPEKAESFKICPDCGCKFN